MSDVKFDFSVEFIQEKMESSPKRAGSFNLFFKLTENIAMKATCCPDERDYNYKRQTKAATKGLGPETFGIIDFSYEGVEYYGYLTEVVEVYQDYSAIGESYKFINIMDNQLGDLTDRLYAEVNFEFTDRHRYNLGIKNGKLICIDFDVVRDRFNRGTKMDYRDKHTSVI